MHHIQLNDQLYRNALRRAEQSGFASVDEYVADVLQQDLHDESDNLDCFFTAERLAHIDRSAAEIQAGNSYTASQADAELAKRRAEWLRQNPS